MTRWIPYPLLFCALIVLWLLLNQTVSVGHILLGAIVAAAASWAMSALNPPPARIKRIDSIARLAGRVLVDIFHSNIAVARIILGGKAASRNPGFLVIPLELRDRYGLTALACVLAATPGTVWLNYDAAKGELLLHVLDMTDETVWQRMIKQRYEPLLREIFE